MSSLRPCLVRTSVAAAALLLAACAQRPSEPVQVTSVDDEVRASASASTAKVGAPPVAIDPARAKELIAERDRCLHEPTCPRSEVLRLTTLAADTGATVDCANFYYGTLVPVDWQRARACYERAVAAETPCAGSSPSLDRVELAFMKLAGQGGPKEMPDVVRPIFSGCFEDVSVTWQFERHDGDAKVPRDFCVDIGGTTLSMDECAEGRVDRQELDRLLIRKDLAARIGKSALAKEELAATAFAPFVRAASELEADQSRGGSMSGLLFVGEKERLIEARNKSLAALATPSFASDAERADVERKHLDALKRARAGADAERAKRIFDAETAFATWRAAEIAFEREASSPADDAKAETDAAVRTTRIWNETLAHAVQGP